MKMNLSRAAKKFRAQIPQEPEAPKPAKAKKKPTTPPAPPPAPVPEPVVETPEPLPEPVVVPAQTSEPTPVPVARPKKPWPVKAKRPRFVRLQAERQERSVVPPLPPRSTKFTARLMTKNLAVPPKDDGTKTAHF